MWLLIALLVQVTTLSSDWSPEACIEATSHVYPEWEYMDLTWAPVARQQVLILADGTAHGWELQNYVVKITSPKGEQRLLVDSYNVWTTSVADVPGTWCVAVRADGTVDDSHVPRILGIIKPGA